VGRFEIVEAVVGFLIVVAVFIFAVLTDNARHK